ncbi:MAG: HAD-IA family hydrolase [Litoreibacter sp.]|nr:HAD-IA family hydrolase [Litoreibacter sp.]
MRMSRTIIFDLDGTLVHSAPDICAAANAMLEGLGRPALSLETVISFIGNGIEKLVERSLLATGGLPEDGGASAVLQFRELYASDLATLTRPYPGVVDTLQALIDSGFQLGVCTNKTQTPALQICETLGLSDFFGVITGVVPGIAHKPEPDMLLNTIEAMGGLPSSCLYVGDSEIDFLTARNAEIPFALFSGGYLKAPISNLERSEIFDNWDPAVLSARFG